MIWCVEDDSSIRDIEVYALTSTGFEAKALKMATVFGMHCNLRSRNSLYWM